MVTETIETPAQAPEVAADPAQEPAQPTPEPESPAPATEPAEGADLPEEALDAVLALKAEQLLERPEAQERIEQRAREIAQEQQAAARTDYTLDTEWQQLTQAREQARQYALQMRQQAAALLQNEDATPEQRAQAMLGIVQGYELADQLGAEAAERQAFRVSDGVMQSALEAFSDLKLEGGGKEWQPVDVWNAVAEQYQRSKQAGKRFADAGQPLPPDVQAERDAALPRLVFDIFRLGERIGYQRGSKDTSKKAEKEVSAKVVLAQQKAAIQAALNGGVTAPTPADGQGPSGKLDVQTASTAPVSELIKIRSRQQGGA